MAVGTLVGFAVGVGVFVGIGVEVAAGTVGAAVGLGVVVGVPITPPPIFKVKSVSALQSTISFESEDLFMLVSASVPAVQSNLRVDEPEATAFKFNVEKSVSVAAVFSCPGFSQAVTRYLLLNPPKHLPRNTQRIVRPPLNL